jgi:hypothetical protein
MKSTDVDRIAAMADTEPLLEPDLVVEELEERVVLGVHGVCACTCTCSCTSTSCIAWNA